MTFHGHIARAVAFSLAACFAQVCPAQTAKLSARPDNAELSLQEKLYSVFDNNKNSVVKVYAQKKFVVRGKDGKTVEKTTLDAGSGFFIGKDGVVMTSAFITMCSEKLWIEWHGLLMDARIVGFDPLTTVAIIRSEKGIRSKNPPIVMMDSSGELARPATILVSISHEMGLPAAPRMGLLSGWNIEFGGAFLPTVYLRTDIMSVRGSTGGPVFDMNGKFVGMTIASIPETAGSFVLPANVAARIRDDILLSGEPVYSWFGLQAQDVPDPKFGTRISVTLVAENGPAKIAGFKTGDIIESIDGTPVKNNMQLRAKTFFVRPGQSSKIVVNRNGESLSLEITAQKMSGDVVKARIESMQKEARQAREATPDAEPKEDSHE